MNVARLPILKQQTGEDTKMIPIAAFECRGLQPIKWNPTGPYCVETDGGTLFDDVGFRDNEDWCEYCEKGDASVLVNHEIPHEFKLHRV